MSERELREVFTAPWEIGEIVPAVFETNFAEPEVQAWRASIHRR